MSVATHLFRGIILNIRKSFRWGTSDSIKLFKWDYVTNNNKRSLEKFGFGIFFTLKRPPRKQL